MMQRTRVRACTPPRIKVAVHTHAHPLDEVKDHRPDEHHIKPSKARDVAQEKELAMQ
jgi:hypothetical protein